MSPSHDALSDAGRALVRMRRALLKARRELGTLARLLEEAERGLVPESLDDAEDGMRAVESFADEVGYRLQASRLRGAGIDLRGFTGTRGGTE